MATLARSFGDLAGRTSNNGQSLLVTDPRTEQRRLEGIAEPQDQQPSRAARACEERDDGLRQANATRSCRSAALQKPPDSGQAVHQPSVNDGAREAINSSAKGPYRLRAARSLVSRVWSRRSLETLSSAPPSAGPHVLVESGSTRCPCSIHWAIGIRWRWECRWMPTS